MISTLSRKYDFDTVFDSQRVFRCILEAMSNPMRAVSICEYAKRLYGEHPALLALAMTLLDNEVSFNTCGNDILSYEIASLTMARKTDVEAADFVFCTENAPGVPHHDLAAVMYRAKPGTLSDPNKSATVIIHDDGEPAYRLTLSGPGINGSAAVQVSQTMLEAIAMRDAQNYEYPQGIDLLFVSSEGELLAVPRLVSEAIG